MSGVGSPAGVSIIIPCFNARDTVAEAIDSVLVQSGGGVSPEIIVVDDGSRDDTAAVASRHPTVRVERTPNRGVSAARNTGLALARADFIKFLDADDILLSGSLAHQFSGLASRSDTSIVFGDHVRVSDRRRRIVRHAPVPTRDHCAQLIMRNILPVAPLYPRSWLDAVGGFDERLSTGEDWNLHVRLAAAGAIFRHWPGAVHEYRIHDAPSRLSVIKDGLADPVGHEIDTILMTRDAVRRDRAIDAAFARQLLWVARVAARRGDDDGARRCFALARRISPRGYARYMGLRYRLLLRLLGFSRWERALVRYWQREV